MLDKRLGRPDKSCPPRSDLKPRRWRIENARACRGRPNPAARSRSRAQLGSLSGRTFWRPFLHGVRPACHAFFDAVSSRRSETRARRGPTHSYMALQARIIVGCLPSALCSNFRGAPREGGPPRRVLERASEETPDFCIDRSSEMR